MIGRLYPSLRLWSWIWCWVQGSGSVFNSVVTPQTGSCWRCCLPFFFFFSKSWLTCLIHMMNLHANTPALLSVSSSLQWCHCMTDLPVIRPDPAHGAWPHPLICLHDFALPVTSRGGSMSTNTVCRGANTAFGGGRRSDVHSPLGYLTVTSSLSPSCRVTHSASPKPVFLFCFFKLSTAVTEAKPPVKPPPVAVQSVSVSSHWSTPELLAAR